MARVEKLQSLIAKLRAKAAEKVKDSNVSVAVGYTAAYAIYVHENVEMKLRGLPRVGGKGHYWDPPGVGQSKFLEQPFRQHRQEYAAIVVEALRRGRTMAQALTLAGLKLQRDSQLLAPVDTGNLKASAFTRLEVPARGPAAT